MGTPGTIEQRAEMLIEATRLMKERNEKEEKELKAQKDALVKEKLDALFSVMATLGLYSIEKDNGEILLTVDQELERLRFR